MRVKFISIMILMSVLLLGCTKQTCMEYIRQPKENVEKIELIYNEKGNESTVLYTIEDDELEDMFIKLAGVSMGKHREPHGSLGYLAIGLYYYDGDVELIGTQASAYLSDGNESEKELDSWHYISYSEVYELFSQYIEPEMMPSAN